MIKTLAIAILSASLIGTNQVQAADCEYSLGDDTASCSGYVNGSYINGDVDEDGGFRGTIDGRYVTCTRYGGCY